ncbi:TonB-dependent receptor [Chryseobacterium sp. MP_3.2]|uniref:TonB-dependent receptor n=1 Tax=Chryseobacterium sp. MP_3.2 TaxID=3071712 RepID=UPI002E072B72|nr:iron complex outermembrane receptor protein [Chryseobacterium sp. MP_3.2]
MNQFLLLFFFGISSLSFGQISDSATLISEVQIDAYKKPTSFIGSTKSVGVISQNLLNTNTAERLLESINQNPGSRVEERSPGSYRIAVRGSSLRSPFGVRNVKVYLDEFILSDASGNTYFNVLSPGLINRMEIFKGPESGDFGAVTGGTLLLKTRATENLSSNISLGSYGTFNQSFDFSKNSGKHFFQIFQNYYQSDSYREQSAVQRKQLFLKDHFQYAENANLKAMVLVSDLSYETPGGLTLEQMESDRKQARLATRTLPGALEQDAGIRNKMILGGLSHEFKIASGLTHFILIQGSYVDFENPFITNFENRFETNYALRTHLNYEKNWATTAAEWRFGYEGGKSNILLKNYDNNKGFKDEPQNFDELKNTSGFFFLSQKLNLDKRLFTDISVSLNSNSYDWKRISPAGETGNVQFKDQILPNFGVTYLLGRGFSLRAKVGKGNSAPNNEEIRSSTQEFNMTLIPEYGWNKEVGLRKQFGKVFFAEASYFDFRLKDAIVRRQNEGGQEFFINQGNTVQKGLEILLESKNFDLQNHFFSRLKFRFSGNFYQFKFGNYTKGDSDFSGNDLTGVPATSLSSLINFTFFKNFGVDYSHFYTSKLPLNDGNTVFSEASFIGNLQFRYPVQIEKSTIDFVLQIQNVYNSEYVLGFDINAFGNRFYNPAAKRTFNFGVNVKF